LEEIFMAVRLARSGRWFVVGGRLRVSGVLDLGARGRGADGVGVEIGLELVPRVVVEFAPQVVVIFGRMPAGAGRRVADREDLDRDILESSDDPREDVGHAGPQRRESGQRDAGREHGGLRHGACGVRAADCGLALNPSLASHIAPAVVAAGSEDDERPLVGLVARAVEVEQHFAGEAVGTAVPDALRGAGGGGVLRDHGWFLFSRASA
jgi:hypothetical protein